MKKLISILWLIAVAINYSIAQGIQFETGLTWSQVLAKAKAENKDIFIDCYATWCGPCKAMDADVYPKAEVGDVYNKQFICVKLQMDRTQNDNDAVKSMYGLANWLSKLCSVTAYPTFLFLDKSVIPLHKAVSYRNPQQFIQLAAEALNPDKQYYRILKNFQPGRLDTAEEKRLARNLYSTDGKLARKIAADYVNRLPQRRFLEPENMQFIDWFDDDSLVMVKPLDYINRLTMQAIRKPENIKLIESLRENKEVRKLAKAYINTLSDKELYSPENIRFITLFTDTSSERGFDFFLHHSVQIDTIMHYDTYAKQLLDRVIYKEVCQPVVDRAKKTTSKPDWDQLTAKIFNNYGQLYVERNLLKAKVDYYEYTKQWDFYAKYFVEQRKGWDVSKISSVLNLNNSADIVFQHSNNKAELETALKWVDRALELGKDLPNAFVMDTRASLLYKLGRTAEALALEERAASLTGFKLIHENYQKMKEGKPTWPAPY